jgi:serine/threonine protein kinase
MRILLIHKTELLLFYFFSKSRVKNGAKIEIYAMKILKETELRRRRQVERTQTERTILAAVRHLFIVCLYYAFQNPQKLYMVMDFVQGCDFSL